MPQWEETGLINWPATLALLGAVFFGVTGTASWPHGWLEATAPNSWGPVPLEAWVIAGALYIALVAVARALGPIRSRARLCEDDLRLADPKRRGDRHRERREAERARRRAAAG